MPEKKQLLTLNKMIKSLDCISVDHPIIQAEGV